MVMRIGLGLGLGVAAVFVIISAWHLPIYLYIQNKRPPRQRQTDRSSPSQLTHSLTHSLTLITLHPNKLDSFKKTGKSSACLRQ